MIVELTTGILMLSSVFSGFTGIKDSINGQASASTSQATTTAAFDAEAYVREYFKDIPILAEVSKCESTFRQFDDNGKPIRGIVNRDDIGVMQINTYYHGERADKLGFDLTTIDGNLGYARYLYGKYGTDPWSSSSKCWKKQIARK